jgi:hypothetical protein
VATGSPLGRPRRIFGRDLWVAETVRRHGRRRDATARPRHAPCRSMDRIFRRRMCRSCRRWAGCVTSCAGSPANVLASSPAFGKIGEAIVAEVHRWGEAARGAGDPVRSGRTRRRLLGRRSTPAPGCSMGLTAMVKWGVWSARLGQGRTTRVAGSSAPSAGRPAMGLRAAAGRRRSCRP